MWFFEAADTVFDFLARHETSVFVVALVVGLLIGLTPRGTRKRILGFRIWPRRRERSRDDAGRVVGLPELIPDEALTLSQVPEPDAPFDQIFAFALTMNGFERHGSFEACARVAEAPDPASLSDLRTCLFLNQRAWNHHGVSPNEETGAELRQLVRQIRACVGPGD